MANQVTDPLQAAIYCRMSLARDGDTTKVDDRERKVPGEPQWDGRVLEVWDDGDTFTVDLRRDGHPDLLAEMSMTQADVTVEEGDLLIVTPTSVAKRDPRIWTQAEIDEIMRRARGRARRLRKYIS